VKAAITLLAGLAATGCSNEPEPLITVSEARVIALPASATAYFTLANSGGRDRLLSVDAAGTGRTSLHETRMEGEMMRMRPMTGGIEIAERGRVRLTPSGKHVMIQDLARPLTAGSTVRLSLRFERQGVVTVNAPVDGPQ
jgi:copper(I)-binding protein